MPGSDLQAQLGGPSCLGGRSSYELAARDLSRLMLSKVIDPIMKYHLWESIPDPIRLCEDCETPKIHGCKKAGVTV